MAAPIRRKDGDGDGDRALNAQLARQSGHGRIERGATRDD